MRLLFLIFTEIAKLNTRAMFWNQQITKLNINKMFFFPVLKVSTREI